MDNLKDHLTIENAARQTLAQIIGGAVLIAGLVFTWANFEVPQKNFELTQKNLKVAEDNIKITQDTATKNQKIARNGQIADRLTKAIALLGEQTPNKLTVRLGGIYALEQIAQERGDYHWPIMEILTAYLRTNSPKLPLEPRLVAPEAPRPPQFAIDIEAVLTVLKRRNLRNEEKGACLNWRSTDRELAHLEQEGACLYWRSTDHSLAHLEQEGPCLNLRSVNLNLANLQEAELTRAQFASAQLRRAYLWKAKLQGAEFYGAKLENAKFREVELQRTCFWRADLRDVDFFKAKLQGADLREANLRRADYSGAELEGANLQDALLEGVTNLIPAQLKKVKNLHQAHLDSSLREAIQETDPPLLNAPNHVNAQPSTIHSAQDQIKFLVEEVLKFQHRPAP